MASQQILVELGRAIMSYCQTKTPLLLSSSCSLFEVRIQHCSSRPQVTRWPGSGSLSRHATTTMSSGRLARILRLWLSFSSLPSLVFATCYCANEGGIDVCGSGSSPCPGIESASGVSLCCVPGDICGADSICHFNHAIAFTSGYYLGGCTDPTFTDPICAQQCCEFIRVPLDSWQMH